MPITSLGAKVVKYLWVFLITVLMLVAAYVSVGRMVMPRLANYQAEIETALTESLGMQVNAQSLQGGWQGFQPTFKLEHISLTASSADDESTPVLNISAIEMKLDVIASLLSTKPVFSSLILAGANFVLTQNEDGKWYLVGMTSGNKKANPLDWLLLQEQLLLRDVNVTLQPLNGSDRKLIIPEWGLKCASQVCSSQGQLRLQPESGHTLEFAANIYGRPGDHSFQVDGYLAMPPIQIMDWLLLAKEIPSELEELESLRLGGEVWVEWGDGQLLDVRGSIDLPELKLTGEMEALTSIDTLNSHFFWQRHTGNAEELWGLVLDDFTFSWEGQPFEPAQRRIALVKKEQGRELQLLADRIDLQPVTTTLLSLKKLPGKVRDSLAVLRPSGQLLDVHFGYNLDSANFNPENIIPDFNLRARLNNIAMAAWQEGPALVSVDGYLEVGPQAGLVDFDSENLAVQFPKLFSDIWLFKKARGVVSWQREGNVFWLKGHDLNFKSELGDVIGQFSSVYSKGEFEPRLSLLIGLENAYLPDAMTFVPDRVMNPKVVDWLAQAFSTGDVKRARFVFDQALIKGSSKITRTMAMDVDASHVDFSFHPDWPQLTQADVTTKIIDKEIKVKAGQARFFDLTLEDITANYTVDPDQGTTLIAKAAVAGELKNAWRTLTETPLQKNIFPLAKDFQFDGSMQGKLALNLPFKDLRKSTVDLDFLTRHASFNIPSLSVSANAIGGVFSYNSQTGLTAKKVEASMFGYPLALAINSKKTESGLSTQFDMQGKIKVGSLAPWVPSFVLSTLEGETNYQARLNLGAGTNSELRIESDLVGIGVSLLEPFEKKSAQVSPFSFTLALDESQLHTLRYGDKFGYSLRFKDNAYQNGVITLGADEPRYQGVPGIQVAGNIPVLNFEQWQQLVEQTQSSGNAQLKSGIKQVSLISKVTDVALNVGRFSFLDEDYDKVSFNAKQQQGGWQVVFDNAQAKGVLNYSPELDKPLMVNFDHLHLPAQPEGQDVPAEAAKKGVLASLKPQQLPALDLRVNELFLGDEVFGSWAFNSRPNQEGIKLEKLAFDLRGMKGNGEMDWRYNQGVHTSQFRGEILIADVGAMLSAWNISRAMEGENARFSGDVSWSGTPDQFSLLGITGPMSMSVDSGRILDVKSLPFLGVLNFNTLSRRLRLDFSDLFKKGFSFDEAQSEFLFDSGIMKLIQPLVINGPSAKFKVEGTTDLQNEQFDHDVIVVLPINDNISVVTTLAGLPQVGIPMYLINRAFGGVFDRFTSINYQVSGGWDDPIIQLNSFFDTKDLMDDKETARKRRPKR